MRLGFAGAALLLLGLSWVVARGFGALGSNNEVAWGLELVNYTWWAGVAHAGVLISAGLLLLQQGWRSSVSRAAEAMALFAWLCALLFSPLHGGLVLGAQLESPLLWDAAGLWTFGLVALLFSWAGAVPGFAALRDSAPSPALRRVSGLLAAGWCGSARHQASWRTGHRVLAGLAVALALGGQSLVAFDFAVTQVPGWHSPLAPFHFVANACLSGLAVLVLLRHDERLARLVLAASLLLSWSWAAGPRPPITPLHLVTALFAVGAPQLLWSARLRADRRVVPLVAVLACAGTWLDRFVTVILPQQHDALAWAPGWVDVCLTVGALLFFTLTAPLLKEAKA